MISVTSHAAVRSATTLVRVPVLRVGDERDPLTLDALAFGPVVVIGLLGLGAAKWVVRRLRSVSTGQPRHASA